MSEGRASKVVALFPWGDVVEEFLDPIGLRLGDFVEHMTGGWLFGYTAALQLLGHTPMIVCASERVDRIERRRHAATGAAVWIVPGRRARKEGSDAAYSVRRWRETPLAAFRDVLKSAACDVILAQEYEYTRFDALAFLARRMGIPLYATFQGGDRTLSWIEAIARQASLRACRGLIVASAGERTRLSRAYPRIDLNIADIPNPIDAEEWRATDRQQARAELGLPADRFLIINHGRIDIRRKGLDVLIEAWAPFAEDRAAELVIIGSGQDREAFAGLLRKGGAPNVRWLSDYTTDRSLLRRWLSAADAYVTASRIEGMPVAPLEAMACGLPVVASEAQGLPDILANGEASGGLLVRREAPDEIADRLRRLRGDAELRHRLGLAARRRVEEKFSLSAVGAALDAFLGAT
ncbi:glycosyltransferase family 4 protein [Mesorhizobium sp. BAC0120]|uniref:glycosyltransferase family 4 protein n=1 Tax=Mesorhizobium sp. BAC0120 TaxID=3090670 RepID=UPI00298CB65F|nr:glycosyltransferase family 4 protein [Mesorhizobium sp. BAC0120]MDW6022002.1 glycosyltransferase family 4 protein [Mesorhizobium sp. BAC0120]